MSRDEQLSESSALLERPLLAANSDKIATKYLYRDLVSHIFSFLPYKDILTHLTWPPRNDADSAHNKVHTIAYSALRSAHHLFRDFLKAQLMTFLANKHADLVHAKLSSDASLAKRQMAFLIQVLLTGTSFDLPHPNFKWLRLVARVDMERLLTRRIEVGEITSWSDLSDSARNKSTTDISMGDDAEASGGSGEETAPEHAPKQDVHITDALLSLLQQLPEPPDRSLSISENANLLRRQHIFFALKVGFLIAFVTAASLVFWVASNLRIPIDALGGECEAFPAEQKNHFHCNVTTSCNSNYSSSEYFLHHFNVTVLKQVCASFCDKDKLSSFKNFIPSIYNGLYFHCSQSRVGKYSSLLTAASLLCFPALILGIRAIYEIITCCVRLPRVINLSSQKTFQYGKRFYGLFYKNAEEQKTSDAASDDQRGEFEFRRDVP